MIYGAGMLIFAVIMLMDVITYTTWRNQLTRRRNQKYWSFSVLFAESGRRFNIQTARKNQSHWKSGPFFSDYLRENFQYFDRSGYNKFSRTDVLFRLIVVVLCLRWPILLYIVHSPSDKGLGEVEWFEMAVYFSNVFLRASYLLMFVCHLHQMYQFRVLLL